MKTIHVGGINPINRAKTLQDAILKAKDDDTIVLHKNETVSSTIDKNIIIDGKGHTLTVESGQAGLVVNAPLELENVTFKVGNRANAMIINAHTTLRNVKTQIQGPVRQFYPTIMNHNQLELEGSTIMNLLSDYDSVTLINDTQFNTYYGGDIITSGGEELSRIDGYTKISNSHLRSIRLNGEAVIDDSIIDKFVEVRGNAQFNNIKLVGKSEKPLVNLKKEPRGPLDNVINAHHILYMDSADVKINNYDIEDLDPQFWGIFADNSDIELSNVNNTEQQASMSITNGTISFVDSVDENRWELTNVTPAFIRSTINSNVDHETATEKLNKLIGLGNVKKNFTSIMNTIKMQQKSSDKNYSFSNHFIFAGDPGTGKTTVAEIFAEALFEVGAIPENKITKATVDELVMGYVGQTAIKTREVLDKALGGVLFIDEAYELTVKDGQNSFNSEALSVIIRYMEDHRDDLVVIAAGYSKEMKDFLASNVGLARRFQWVEFEDYTPEELAQIFELIRESYGEAYDDNNLKRVIPILFDKLTKLNLSIPDAKGRVTNGGNGGLSRNVYQRVIQHRNDRAVNGGTSLITKEDIEAGFKVEMTAALNRKL